MKNLLISAVILAALTACGKPTSQQEEVIRLRALCADNSNQTKECVDFRASQAPGS